MTYHVTTVDRIWCIVDGDTGRTKMIGKVQGRGINYHDRAIAEAMRRNGDSERPVVI